MKVQIARIGAALPLVRERAAIRAEGLKFGVTATSSIS